MAALRWIQGVKQWPPFIENRVTMIQKMGLVSSFRYINTEANLADLLTRGLTFDQIKDKKLWRNGPSLEVLDLTVEEEPAEDVQVMLSVAKDDNFIDF